MKTIALSQQLTTMHPPNCSKCLQMFELQTKIRLDQPSHVPQQKTCKVIQTILALSTSEQVMALLGDIELYLKQSSSKKVAEEIAQSALERGSNESTETIQDLANALVDHVMGK